MTTAVKRHLYPSESRPGAYWKVVTAEGRYDCNCPGVIHSKDGECVHIKTQRSLDRNMTNQTAIALREEGRLIVPNDSALVTDSDIRIMSKIAATVLEAGGMVPDTIKTPQAALAVMLAGHELGIPPFAALRTVFIVNGRTELMTQGLLALLRARDPSAEIIWHQYDAKGADVELFRNGRSMIRVTYNESDRELSKQGYKKVGQWKATQTGKRYFEQAKDSSGAPKWEMDHESPWQRFPRDMYAYNAVKRAIRLGAPDVLYVRPLPPQVAFMEEEARIEAAAVADETPLQAALISGEITPAAVFETEEEPAVEEEVKAECDHDWKYNDDTTLIVCVKCGLVQDEPPSEEQPALRI